MFTPFSLKIGGELRNYTRPLVMGIVNITPDSFYPGSRTMNESEIGLRIEGMIEDGVDIIDIGAYSSRPGADDVSLDNEIDRLRKGMAILRSISPNIPVSIDTFRSEVAKIAVDDFGADIINDISGGTIDSRMFETIAELRVPYILMHMRGTPATMQQYTDYENIVADVIADLSVKLRKLHLLGVSDVIIDPGFGFSKTIDQNFELMRELPSFNILGCPVLAGISRKSMITRSLGISTDEALAPTVALDMIALIKGASIIRVHDVKEAVRSVSLYMKSC